MIARAALFLVLSLATAHATPSQDLDRGRSSYRAHDYQSAIQVLNLLLYPGQNALPMLSLRDDLIEAHLLLAGALFETGNKERARIEFEAALKIDPDRSITTLLFTEGAVRLFEDTKSDYQRRQREAAERKRIAEAREAIEAYKKSLVVYEAKPYFFNFVPFGGAQVSQKRYLAAALIGVPQVATIVTSGAIYGYLVNKYGLRSTSVPLADGPRVRRLQQIEIGTGIAFFGLYAIGVYDAIRHYKPRLRVEGDDSFLPPELKEKPDAPAPPPAPRKLKKVSLLDRLGQLSFAPMITDDGVGIGIGWEND